MHVEALKSIHVDVRQRMEDSQLRYHRSNCRHLIAINICISPSPQYDVSDFQFIIPDGKDPIIFLLHCFGK